MEELVRKAPVIHECAAAGVSPSDAFLGYDERRAAAARLAGPRTIAPAG